MILIADSGSSKTDWSCIDGKNVIRFKTIGLNPYFVSSEQIEQEINRNIPQVIDKDRVVEVYFFGSGCGRKESQLIVQHALQVIFSKSQVVVESDLFGAGLACYGRCEAGIVAILGTGMNIGFWQGPSTLATPMPSLGFILGDAGSGASLGKRLIKAIFEKQLSLEITERFHTQYSLTVSELLDKLYKQPRANAFLASFVPFIADNIDNEQMQTIVTEAFDEFVRIYASQISKQYNTKAISFIGSIAKVFEANLLGCLSKNGYDILQIVDAPIALLEDRFMQ